MKASAVIRPVHVADLPALIVLCDAHAEFEGGRIDTEQLESRLQAAIFSPVPRLWGWVAAQNGRLLGYATASCEFSTWTGREYLHMDCLYVVDGQRGRGLGAGLLGAVEAHARANDIDHVQWQTPHWNEDAARFYRRTGAEESAKLRFRWPLIAERAPQPR